MSTPTPEEARQALADIDVISRQVRQAVRGDGLVSNILMLWGVLWMLIFMCGYLAPPRAVQIIWGLNGLGVMATAFLMARRGKQVRSASGSKIGMQLAFFWAVVMVYAIALPFLLGLSSWPTRLALMLSVVMLGYVIQGIWMKDKIFIMLGLFITVAILVCHAWLALPAFLLALGLLGGGGLLAGGLAVRLGWR